jgi:DNA mismatch endonuclease, patch repair protein
MTDIVDRVTRSRMMSSIRGGDTVPELAVRRYLHAAGVRFRLHDRRLPGTPDIVIPMHKVAVFVHGCFWHRHPACRFATKPASNPEFWNAKFARNVARDAEKERSLLALGWCPVIIWECETRDAEALDRLFWQIRAGQRETRANDTRENP